jgi:hypothetical protein
VEWSDVIYVKWFCFEVKWSELKWSSSRQKYPVLRATLYWGYLIVLWLFHLVCILCCGCFNWFCVVWVCVCVGVCMCGFCNAWVCVCVGFVMCRCFGNTCTCIYCIFALFVRLCIFILICFVCTAVRTAATEWQINCNKDKGLQQQAEVAQRVPGRLRLRIFLTFCTTRVVGRQPYAPAAFTPGKIPRTHF